MTIAQEQQEEDPFVAYLLRHHEEELLRLLQAPDPERHYGVPVSLTALAAAEPALADQLLAAPRAALQRLEAALRSAQARLLAAPPAHAAGPGAALWSAKDHVHPRLSAPGLWLDPGARAAAPGAGELGAPHADRLVTVAGVVTRAGPVRVLEARRLYECTRCQHRFVVAADLELGGVVQLPAACPSGRDKPCPGSAFRHCDEVALYTNWQEVTVQQRAEDGTSTGSGAAAPGTHLPSLAVLLLDDLADVACVGDEVEATGVVIRQLDGGCGAGARCTLGLALQATALHVRAAAGRQAEGPSEEEAELFARFWEAHAHRPLTGRNKLVASVCPQLAGLYWVKLATLLMLVGGNPLGHADPAAGGGGEQAGLPSREELHMLLVGDPGTGKSQFQRCAARLARRAVCTSGRSASGAGLTAAAVREGEGWALEAGALVLADGGLCCIDEFDAMKEADSASLHEAMEQQTCSVAKAGMVTKLPTRTTVFGTCNPRGNRRYNPRLPLASQLAVPPALLSRFDLVILLADGFDPEWDATVADHILRAHVGAAQPGGAAAAEGWPVETLRRYISWVRPRRPPLSPEAESLLRGYYHWRRAAAAAAGGGGAALASVRLLESAVRIAQAHAKLLAREQVGRQDAVVAAALVHTSAPSSSCGGGRLDDGPVASQARFPGDPEAEYRALERWVDRLLAEDAECEALGGGGGGVPTLQWRSVRAGRPGDL